MPYLNLIGVTEYEPPRSTTMVTTRDTIVDARRIPATDEVFGNDNGNTQLDYDKLVEAWLQNKDIEDAHADCYNLTKAVDRATWPPSS